jgi:hypothetical protein
MVDFQHLDIEFGIFKEDFREVGFYPLTMGTAIAIKKITG